MVRLFQDPLQDSNTYSIPHLAREFRRFHGSNSGGKKSLWRRAGRQRGERGGEEGGRVGGERARIDAVAKHGSVDEGYRGVRGDMPGRRDKQKTQRVVEYSYYDSAAMRLGRMRNGR
eukprot:758838-Hanusia_phi.AAC.1